MKTTFTADWVNWINTNVENGQDKDGLFKILLDEGYSFDAIVKQMNYKPSTTLDKLVNPFEVAKQQRKIQQVRINQHSNNGLKSSQHAPIFLPNAKRFVSDDLELYTLDNFLNETECNKIIKLIRSKLRPSELTSAETDKAYRTSRTCDLGKLNDKFMETIDQRICDMIGIDESYSEVVQGQLYDVGQQFKAHTDFFEAHEIEQFGAQMGQRTYTFMIYLNDVEEGGETAFVNVGESIKPKTGMAVIWNSLYSDGKTNSDSMHHGMPVIKGYKAVITKWFRTYSRLTPAPSMMSKSKNEYVHNFTEIGFKKSKLPEPLFAKIRLFYQDNKHTIVDEHVPGDFIYNEASINKKNTNKNKKSSALVELTDSLREEVHNAMKPLLEQWTGQKLAPTYVYGIRVYFDGAVLKMHRDRIETHIISVILNVDQEVKQDWPLTIEDNYYRKHHIMLKPGEMIFYEGARLSHGRPTPFSGSSYANIFCHFQPEN
ncbi:2OG-Fe(II) oxygenase [Colwellia sp. E2M01]|uniref:prolyl hydroxylase family protein n=1 Tax=Colwellia sp. E2M01 TaxID=2841561 RepID=UPI001C09DF9C|nr:2OG-Fe(II) oxygenase [Colwellia sp. E2M01]MBU2871772.1 2OG-Fe(II) oxygenase [Colwellia sp. E2M01]